MAVVVVDFLKSLDQRQVPEGFAPFPGEEARADATAWGLLAFAVFGQEAADSRVWESLKKSQQSNGAVALLPEGPKSIWVTSVAILAWTRTNREPEAVQRAVEFLLACGAERPKAPTQQQKEVIGHDMALRGWPWIEGTASWVDTTALALLALRAAGRTGEERYREGIQLILNRQLPSGGWNYGNTLVYGAELRPTSESTGAALFALAGQATVSEVEASLTYLKSVANETAAPLTAAWSQLALQAWKQPLAPLILKKRVAGLLGEAAGDESMPTEWIALLVLAQADWEVA